MYQEMKILRRPLQWEFCTKGNGDSNGRIEAGRQRRNRSLLAPIWYSLVEWEAEHMKRRFLPFRFAWQCCWLFFTGCYSAQKNGPSAPASSQTVQSDSGSATENSVEIRTYDIPEEKCSGGYQICSVSPQQAALDVDIVHAIHIRPPTGDKNQPIFRVIRQVASIAMHFARLILVRYRAGRVSGQFLCYDLL